MDWNGINWVVDLSSEQGSINGVVNGPTQDTDEQSDMRVDNVAASSDSD
jgi:hypothetical protein